MGESTTCLGGAASRSVLSARAARLASHLLVLLALGSSGACLPLHGVTARTPTPGAGLELSPASCLLRAPIDLSINLREPMPRFYVNELRLGYARGQAVFLSRPLCEMYGEALCRFVEAHEQAHHYTNTVGQQSMCAETVADCWAAVHADAEAVSAALEFFRGRQGSGGYHGEPSERAGIISQCANRRANRG